MTESRRGFLLGRRGVRHLGAVPALLAAARAGRRGRDPGPPDRLVAASRWACWCSPCGRTAVRPLARGRPRVPARCWRSPRCLITVNWAIYIWGVNNGHVVETSLGLLHQPAGDRADGRLHPRRAAAPLQWAALGVAALAVVVLTLDYGRPPWIALVLAFSFGSYGLCKKQANAPAVESLTFETMVLAPGRARLPRLARRGTATSSFGRHGAGPHAAAHAAPASSPRSRCCCFGGAAIRVPLVDARAAAVPRPDPAVRARRARTSTRPCRRPLGRLRPGVGRAGDVHRRGAAPPPASCGSRRPARWRRCRRSGGSAADRGGGR